MKIMQTWGSIVPHMGIWKSQNPESRTGTGTGTATRVNWETLKQFHSVNI